MEMVAFPTSCSLAKKLHLSFSFWWRLFGRSSAKGVLPFGPVADPGKNAIDLNGKVVLVTGGTRGIGKATCEQFAHAGCTVIGTTRKKDPQQTNTYDMIELDVCSDTSVKQGIDWVVNKYGRLDILVNNAGIGQYGRLITASAEHWKQVFETNVFGVHRVTVAAYPHMLRPDTRIITLGSLDGEIGYPYQAIYAASKRTLHTWSDLFAVEQRNVTGPTFSLLEPAFVNTGFGTSADVVNTEPNTDDPYAKANVLSFPWFLKKYGIPPAAVGQAICRIAATRQPKPRYFITGTEKIFLGKSVEDILVAMYAQPIEDHLAFLRAVIEGLYLMYRMGLIDPTKV